MIKHMIIIFLFLSGTAFSQVNDDFTDGEIQTNPAWSGDTSLFGVVDPGNSGDGSLAAGANDDGMVLRSEPSANDAVIATQSNTAEGEWTFSVAEGAGWSLSGSNNYNIILISDKNDVNSLKDGSMDFHGYYLHRGCSGGDDVFELYRQDSTSSSLILNTGYPAIADGTGAENGHTIKITRDKSGLWKIFINEGFDTIPYTQRGADIVDTSYNSSSYFGISTNIANASTKRVLYFDNLEINGAPVNLSPPGFLSIDSIAPDKMALSWTKPSGVNGIDWDGVIVFACEDTNNIASVTGTDGSDYTENSVYGSGTQNNNSYCVANKISDDNGYVVVGGLVNGKRYCFIAYTYKEVSGNSNDLWSVACGEVCDTSRVKGVSNFTSSSDQTSAHLSWDNYSVMPGLWWDEVLVTGKRSSAVDRFPSGTGNSYYANSVFGSGTELGGPGSGNFIVYKGVGDSVHVSNLTSDSIYYFRIYARYDTMWTLAGEYQDLTAFPFSGSLLISEIADPVNNTNARFIELFNSGNKSINLNNEEWYVCMQVNGTSWKDVQLSGIVCPNCTYVISFNETDFLNSYFYQPDQTSSDIDGDGNDGYFLYKGGNHQTGQLIDSYGIIDQDGSGTAWEYTDSRVVRNDSVSCSQRVWSPNEWTILPQSYTGDMKPGEHKGIIRWQGSVSANWNDGANWTGGRLPDTNIVVIINETAGFYPVIIGNTRCSVLNIYPSGRMNIETGGSLNVTNDINIYADSSGVGSIISDDPNDLSYGGLLSIERYFGSNNKWHYVSSPISDATANTFFSCYLNSWNETSQTWDHIIYPGTTLDIAKGYSVFLPSAFGNKAVFSTNSGNINAGNYSTPFLSYTSGQDSSLNGFNFIGNPYPSSIDWDLVSIPTTIDAAIYYWDPSAGVQGSYKSYVPGLGGSGSRYVPPMHGFFIHAKDTSNIGTITFENHIRVHEGQNISYKQGTYPSPIKIRVCGNGFCDETYIQFSPHATQGFDSKMDAYKVFTFDSIVPQVYTSIYNADLSFNSLPLDPEGLIIPLGFKSGSQGVFKLELNQQTINSPDNQIFLKDKITGNYVNLSKCSTYSFNYDTGDICSRFLLYINYSITENQESFSGISIRTGVEEIVIESTGEREIRCIDIYNILGQIVKHVENSSDKMHIHVNKGTYLIRVVSDNKIFTEKLLIR
jgi:hypothetical protein